MHTQNEKPPAPVLQGFLEKETDQADPQPALQTVPAEQAGSQDTGPVRRPSLLETYYYWVLSRF